jgi:hypothetical protein
MDNATNQTLPGGATIEQLVDAPVLLATLWPEVCRPSLAWLRKRTRARAFPYVRLGRRIFYRPSEVQRWLNDKYTIRPKTATSAP